MEVNYNVDLTSKIEPPPELTTEEIRKSQIILGIVITVFFIIAFALTAICSIIALFSSGPLVFTSSQITKRFENFEVVFDTYYSVPVSSTQFNRTDNTGARTPWRDESFSAIKSTDYQTINQTLYDRGHLSPFRSLGRESMTIINAVPQLSKQNRGVWSQFEGFVEDNYISKNEVIVTYPVYTFLSFFETPNGKLYIPSKLCKIIRGVHYCMDHVEPPVGANWCDLVYPRICTNPVWISEKEN
jgi:hypothetical protein